MKATLRRSLLAWTGGESVGWLAWSLAIAAFAFAPVAAIAALALQGSSALWPHLLAYVLPQAAQTTAMLLLGVGALVIVVGTGTAWLVTAYDFPFRRTIAWALLLPLAIPTYIAAFAYLDILHPIGPAQTALRALLGYASPAELRLPEVRSLGGCVLMLGLVLFPYVYLPTRALFLMQAAGLIEASRTLGAGPGRIFLSVALPLARPAIAVGTSLALMEALNDIGASEFLGVRTLTVSIYSTWLNRSDLAGAAQIAIVMLLVVLSLVLLERRARRARRYAAGARQARRMEPTPLNGAAAWGACALAALPVALGFLVPAGYLAIEAGKRLRFAGISDAILKATLNTVQISVAAALLTGVLGLVLAYAMRVTQAPAAAAAARVASLGYAVPGTVLALGALAPLGMLDRAIDMAARELFDVRIGLLISGSGMALVCAYAARFLAIATGGLEAGFAKIPPSLDDAARTMRCSRLAILGRIHLPLLQPALGAAMLLVLVDCMKELPATLLLRPLNFETLATHLYGEAARGTYEDGAVAALLIVLVGLVPVALLARLGAAPQAQAARA